MQGPMVMNRTNPRISLQHLEIRGEDGDKQVWMSAHPVVPELFQSKSVLHPLWTVQTARQMAG